MTLFFSGILVIGFVHTGTVVSWGIIGYIGVLVLILYARDRYHGLR
jgi:hypothetical protein